MPSNKVGLVLGAVKTLPSGYPNRYFKYRIQAAYDLYKSGKVEYLLVSGDNHTKGYNEPEDMRNDLIAMGVPADKIYMDYAGFRTLDSVVRCSEIFGQDKFTIVSQKFHNERAVFIGEKKGLDLIAYNANAVGRRNFPIINVDRNQLRELLAKTKAVLDLYILNKQPRFSGKKIVIGKDPVVLG